MVREFDEQRSFIKFIFRSVLFLLLPLTIPICEIIETSGNILQNSYEAFFPLEGCAARKSHVSPFKTLISVTWYH